MTGRADGRAPATAHSILADLDAPAILANANRRRTANRTPGGALGTHGRGRTAPVPAPDSAPVPAPDSAPVPAPDSAPVPAPDSASERHLHLAAAVTGADAHADGPPDKGADGRADAGKDSARMAIRTDGGAVLLDSAREFVGRFCALPSGHAYVAVTLWAAHAHVIDAFESTPRLAFLSPEPASGKTRALEVLELLVPNPMLAVNATPAALFRSVADLASRPTILFDEIDTVFGPKAKDNEELRGLFNAGHRRSGVAYRCVGEGTRQAVVAFPAYAALAVAGLGNLPDTILTRAVVIRMRRRAPGERVEPFRERTAGPAGRKLGSQLRDWTASAGHKLASAWPDLPEGITDRPADVWEPLLAIADLAGGHWPGSARQACLHLASQNTGRAVSLGIRLLGDLRDIFGPHRTLPTEHILTALCGLDSAPWGDLKGAPLDSRGLARILSQYDIEPCKVKAGGRSLQGYRAEHLADAWNRYLPPSGEAEPPEPAEPPRSEGMAEVLDEMQVPEPAEPDDAGRFRRFRNPGQVPEPQITALICASSAGSGGSALAETRSEPTPADECHGYPVEPLGLDPIPSRSRGTPRPQNPS